MKWKILILSRRSRHEGHVFIFDIVKKSCGTSPINLQGWLNEAFHYICVQKFSSQKDFMANIQPSPNSWPKNKCNFCVTKVTAFFWKDQKDYRNFVWHQPT